MGGMYNVAGNTPRQKVKGRGPKTNTFITSRVIGVEVHCADVHGTILYYTDDLTGGGANTIIEVTRQGEDHIIINFIHYIIRLIISVCFITAILDLQQLLQRDVDKSGNKLDMPRDLILQFDNCSENKVSLLLKLEF